MSRKILIVQALSFVFLGVFTVGRGVEAQVAPKDATEETKKANSAPLQQLLFSDKTDFENANKGFIATLPDLTIKDENGRI